jgi:hypothetical protein
VAVATLAPARAASHSTEVVEGPIYQYGICAATVAALNAGVDLPLVAYDSRQFYRIFDCAPAASARGAVDRTVMAKAIARLDARARPATQAAASAPR